MGIEIKRRRGFGEISYAPAMFLEQGQAILDSAPTEIAYAAADSVVASGGPEIEHFAYLPPGGIREAQVLLAAWGRPLTVPSPSSPYGLDGPLFPPDFGLTVTDLDGTDDSRTGLAIASFQRWYGTKTGLVLPAGGAVEGTYDQGTDTALRASQGVAGVPAGIPGSNTLPPVPSIPLPPPPSNVIPFPIPPAANVPGTSSKPGNVQGGASTAPSSRAWAWGLVGAGALGLVLVVVVARRRRRKGG